MRELFTYAEGKIEMDKASMAASRGGESKKNVVSLTPSSLKDYAKQIGAKGV